MSQIQLPHDYEVEKAVLGAMLLENKCIEEVVVSLKSPSDFYDLKHQIIYGSILEMYGKIQKIDILTVTSWIRKEGLLDQAGGPSYIVELTMNINSSAHTDAHTKILAEYSIGRKIMEISMKLQSDGHKKPDYLEMLEQLSKEVYKLEGTYFTKETQSIFSLSKRVMEEVQRAGEKQDGITGEITGIEAIDNYTGGLGSQDFVVIAARPGMGKSSIVHSMIHSRAIDHKKATALFTLEMSSEQVTKVLHSHQTGIDHEKLKTGKLDPHEWIIYHQKIQPLLEAGIYLDDTPSISVTEIRAKARRLVSRYNVSMIIVDYIQLATANYERNKRPGNREQEISEISRGLKALAKELNVPVVALAQLSREAEKRANKLPILSDLRESGAIEQDADQVWFLFRPAYYKMEVDDAGNRIPKHLTKLIIAKYREGDLGELDLRFIGRMKKFDSMPEYNDGEEGQPMAPQKSALDSHSSFSTFDNSFDDDEKPF